MKLLDFIYKLCFEARRIPNIGFICPDGNIYNLNHFQNIKYPAFCASQLQHSEEGDWRYYQFNLFYVDRLVSSHKNTQEIQSEAVDALSRIIRNITSYGIETRGSVLYDVFTEKFDSECAGAYATVTFGTMVDDVCPEWYDTPLYLIKWHTPSDMQPEDYYFTPDGDKFRLTDNYYKIIYQGHDEHTGYIVYTDTSPKDGAGEYGDHFTLKGNADMIDFSQANSIDFRVDKINPNPMRDVIFPETLVELQDMRGFVGLKLRLPKSLKYLDYAFGNVGDARWVPDTIDYDGTMAEFEAIGKNQQWSGGTSSFGRLQYIQCSDGIICLRDCTDTFPYFTGNTTGDTDVQCRTIPFEEKTPYEFGDEDYLYIMGWNLSRSASDAPARVCLESGTGRLVARQTGDIRNSSISSNYGLRPWVTFRVHYNMPSDSSEGMYIELPYEGKWLSVNGVGQVITTTGQTTLFFYAEDGEGNTWLETGDHLALSVGNDGYLVGRRYGDGFAFTWGQLKDLCSDPDYPYCTYDCGADCPEDFCLGDSDPDTGETDTDLYVLYSTDGYAVKPLELNISGDPNAVQATAITGTVSGDTLFVDNVSQIAVFSAITSNGKLKLKCGDYWVMSNDPGPSATTRNLHWTSNTYPEGPEEFAMAEDRRLIDINHDLDGEHRYGYLWEDNTYHWIIGSTNIEDNIPSADYQEFRGYLKLYKLGYKTYTMQKITSLEDINDGDRFVIYGVGQEEFSGTSYFAGARYVHVTEGPSVGYEDIVLYGYTGETSGNTFVMNDNISVFDLEVSGSAFYMKTTVSGNTEYCRLNDLGGDVNYGYVEIVTGLTPETMPTVNRYKFENYGGFLDAHATQGYAFGFDIFANLERYPEYYGVVLQSLQSVLRPIDYPAECAYLYKITPIQ